MEQNNLQTTFISAGPKHAYLVNALIQSRKLGLMVISKDLHCLEWNVGIELFSNIPRQSVINQKLTQYFSGFEKTKHFQVLNLLFSDSFSDEESFNTISFWRNDLNEYSFSYTPVKNDSGETESCMVVVNQLMLHPEVQKDKIYNEYKTLAEHCSVGIWRVDREGYTQYVNPALCALLGVNDPDDIKGQRIHNFMTPESIEKMKKEYYEKRIHHVSSTYEAEIVREDGGTRSVLVHSAPLGKSEKEIEGMIATFTDITENKKAEKAIIESEAKFRGIFEASIVGIMFSNAEGKIIDANNRFLEMLGYTREELNKGTLQWQKITPQEYLEMDYKAAKEVLIKSHIAPYEKEYFRKDGSRVPVLVTASLLKNPTVNFGVGFVVDLSELKKSKEETVKVANELSTFLYMASHDLKGPLASVIGLTNIAQKEVNEPQAQEYLSLIKECTLKLDRSLMNFLKIIRIKNNVLEEAKIDFGEMISEILNSLKHQASFDNVNFSISVSQKRIFYSDQDMIRSIIQNLVENAVKYQTRLRIPEVKIRIEDDQEYLIIKVEDNGRGIDEKIKDKIFDIFYRGDISSKGSGLGLYIVKTASESLNGSVTMENKKDGGCIFSIKIPISG